MSVKRFTTEFTYGIQHDMETGKLIKKYRKLRNLTQEALAFELKVSKAYISAIENDQKSVSLNQLLKFASALDIPSSEIDRARKEKQSTASSDSEFDQLIRAKENLEKFLQERGLVSDITKVSMIPVVGAIPAGTPIYTFEDAVDIAESHFPVPSTEIKHSRCFFLRVSGDSMIDIGIHENDLVLVDPEDREISGIGRVMAIEVDSEVTLKTVVRLDDKRLRLVPENSRYAPFEVILKKQRVKIIGAILPFMARWNPNLR